MNLSEMGPVDGHLCKCRPYNFFFRLETGETVHRFKGTINVSTKSRPTNLIPITIPPRKASKIFEVFTFNTFKIELHSKTCIQ